MTVHKGVQSGNGTQLTGIGQ